MDKTQRNWNILKKFIEAEIAKNNHDNSWLGAQSEILKKIIELEEKSSSKVFGIRISRQSNEAEIKEKIAELTANIKEFVN